MKNFSLSILAVSGVFTGTATVEAVDYQTEIRPILSKRCFQCHSGPRAKGKLKMDDKAKFAERIGDHDNAVFKPGNPTGSLAIIKASLPQSDSDAMPPPAARSAPDPMTRTELALVRKWVEEGAKLEPGDTPDTPPTTEPASETTTETMAPDKTKIQSWSNASGKALQAFFVALSNDLTQVKLKKEDGTEFVYDMSKLSAESQALAKKLAGK